MDVYSSLQYNEMLVHEERMIVLFKLIEDTNFSLASHREVHGLSDSSPVQHDDPKPFVALEILKKRLNWKPFQKD